MSTSFHAFNDTPTASSDVVNSSDVISTLTPFLVTGNTTEAGCGKEGGACNVTQSPSSSHALCTRLAPPPVPPWLRESPERLYEMTKHCKSWSMYQELCTSGASNSTLGYPRYVDTSEEDEVKAMALGPGGLQWVIPALALVVLLLLLVLALVLYKNYRRPHKKSMYRVAGSGYRFKPPQSSGSWAGGPLVESETSDSYLGHPGVEPGADFRYSRSPVCRLLEQTQYVATPTEDEHRPRPSGPPAFTSPAYFLPALAWLRLPLLRHSWPGESNGAARDTTRYNAARPVHCDCGGETTHQWRPEGEGQWAESRADNDPEYSEILDGHANYSTLDPTPLAASNGLGPYEYEMQERVNGHAWQEPYPEQPQPPRGAKSRHLPGHEHRYEKLWPSSQPDSASLAPRELSSSTPGTCENGWLSRYRLPSPIFPASDPPCRRPVLPDLAHFMEGGMTADELTSDTELLPCESVMMVPSGCGVGGAAHRDRRSSSRSEVKYPNPVYEGRGRQAPPPPASSPLLSRLLGYISWSKR